MLQLALDLGDELAAPAINVILRIEERTALLVALGFQRLDVLLTSQFLFQREGRGGRATGFLDLAIEFLDLPFQAQLQVVRPAVELLGFRLEEAGVALGDGVLDFDLMALGHLIEATRRRRQYPLPYLTRQREETPGGFFIQRLAGIRDRGENEVILGLIERLDRE